MGWAEPGLKILMAQSQLADGEGFEIRLICRKAWGREMRIPQMIPQMDRALRAKDRFDQSV